MPTVSMQYTCIRDGFKVSRIGLGCMGMSEFYGRTDDRQSLETLRAAPGHGINHFDTADVYGRGHNESLLARAFRDIGSDIMIASKFGVLRDSHGRFIGLNGRPAYVRQACEASLRRLNRNTIDLYYAHRLDPDVPLEETVGAMAELVSAGKVRYLGLCEVTASELQRAHKVHPITALQSEYSLWHREIERSVLPVCQELGIAVFAYSPLGRGFLSGQIHSPGSLEQDDWRRSDPRLQGEALEKNRVFIETISEMAGRLHATPAQLALAWLLHRHDNVIPIPGTRHPRRLAENARSASIHFQPGDLLELDRLPVTAHKDNGN